MLGACGPGEVTAGERLASSEWMGECTVNAVHSPGLLFKEKVEEKEIGMLVEMSVN